MTTAQGSSHNEDKQILTELPEEQCVVNHCSDIIMNYLLCSMFSSCIANPSDHIPLSTCFSALIPASFRQHSKIVDITSVNLFTADCYFEIWLHTNNNAFQAMNIGGIIMHHSSKTLFAEHKTLSCKSSSWIMQLKAENLFLGFFFFCFFLNQKCHSETQPIQKESVFVTYLFDLHTCLCGEVEFIKTAKW